MPLHDWQFWLVSLLALGGVWLIVKPFVPRRRSSEDPACTNCASGSAASKKSRRRVELTIDRKRV